MTNETTKCDACETRDAAWESLDRTFACAECVGPKPEDRGWAAMRIPAPILPSLVSAPEARLNGGAL